MNEQRLSDVLFLSYRCPVSIYIQDIIVKLCTDDSNVNCLVIQYMAYLTVVSKRTTTKWFMVPQWFMISVYGTTIMQEVFPPQLHIKKVGHRVRRQNVSLDFETCR